MVDKRVIVPQFDVVYHGPMFNVKTGKKIDNRILEEHGHDMVHKEGSSSSEFVCKDCGITGYVSGGGSDGQIYSHKVANMEGEKVVLTCEEYKMENALK